MNAIVSIETKELIFSVRSCVLCSRLKSQTGTIVVDRGGGNVYEHISRLLNHEMFDRESGILVLNPMS